MSRFLTIMEVSQKQNYVFSSNKLAECVERSDQITSITGTAYLEKVAGDCFSGRNNLVYAGGGHTILEFPSKKQAVGFCKKVTRHIRKTLPEMELFCATIAYDENQTHDMNQKELIKALEKKKSQRLSVFHQGTFGIEKLDTNNKKPIYVGLSPTEENYDNDTDCLLMPDGYDAAKAFADLGGSKNESNYIAVIHIDGNGMGKRVSDFYERNQNVDWESFKEKERQFSESIDRDYKNAYKSMLNKVAKNIDDGVFADLSLKRKGSRVLLPVRRIITSGDDVCFVSEGRIGIECAVELIKNLNKIVNEVDGLSYSACAGVTIVHQKYPFYKAYEIAEALCSNAKKLAASISPDDNGASVSAIDWHIEHGELGDTIEDIRKNYIDDNGKVITGRPYIIDGPDAIMAINENKKRNYTAFQKAIQSLKGLNSAEGVPRGKVKGLREVIRKGETEANNYQIFYKMDDITSKIETDMEFDAIEIMDTFLLLN